MRVSTAMKYRFRCFFCMFSCYYFTCIALNLNCIGESALQIQWNWKIIWYRSAVTPAKCVRSHAVERNTYAALIDNFCFGEMERVCITGPNLNTRLTLNILSCIYLPEEKSNRLRQKKMTISHVVFMNLSRFLFHFYLILTQDKEEFVEFLMACNLLLDM